MKFIWVLLAVTLCACTIEATPSASRQKRLSFDSIFTTTVFADVEEKCPLKSAEDCNRYAIETLNNAKTQEEKCRKYDVRTEGNENKIIWKRCDLPECPEMYKFEYGPIGSSYPACCPDCKYVGK